MAHPRPPRAVGAPHATVVVPARDRAEELARCLAALGRKTPVVVVDDGSADRRTIADVAATYGATLIRRECSEGPGRARNAALEAIDTELIAFLDSDCIPEPDWIARLATHFADPQVGAVAPRVRPLSPAPGAPFRERFAAARSPIDLGPAESAVVPGGRVPYVPTAAIVVRRAALERAFDPALRYGEDVDLVWRLHDAGWRVRYDPTVIVEHSEPQSWQRLLARRMALRELRCAVVRAPPRPPRAPGAPPGARGDRASSPRPPAGPGRRVDRTADRPARRPHAPPGPPEVDDAPLVDRVHRVDADRHRACGDDPGRAGSPRRAVPPADPHTRRRAPARRAGEGMARPAPGHEPASVDRRLHRRRRLLRLRRLAGLPQTPDARTAAPAVLARELTTDPIARRPGERNAAAAP